MGLIGRRRPRTPFARRSSLAALAALATAASALLGLLPTERPHASHGQTAGVAAAESCITCHAGIEEMHPGYPLGCVDCHGGDAAATTKEAAHVRPSRALPGDERVLPLDWDPAWLRFRNPTDLRVVDAACGTCHGDLIEHVKKSLHGTTAGHLGDGFYEHGVTRDKRPGYSVFPVRDTDGQVPPGALAATEQVPPHRGGPLDEIATHYTDLPRKACMQCHLWSEGRAVRGRLGLDGDYRGQGCAACHVTYAEDGRSRSRDATIDKLEPGHPYEHRLTSRIPTATCTRCHYGDASIGLHFRGLAQLVPGQPAGPRVPGTTDALQNGVFYVRDPAMTPPDVHHERGLHCIDCHTLADTMGDGNIWPQMDHAVEIECESCHGTFDRVTDLTTSRGRRVPNLERRGDDVWLVSKVTGARHRVVQVKHVLDPARQEYSATAAAAMTPQHASLECYACHSAWNVDFFGFHFDRNLQFTQLDLLSGQRTPGRVTTQEKVFATFNQLRLGWNHEQRLAPYMVGFSTIGSAHDRKGEAILRQAAPATAAGLSGVTLVPHQVHTTRKETRTCVECHRSPATWGLGSPNFRLAREFAYAITRDALLAVALDHKTLPRSTVAASLALPGDLRAIALASDVVHGRATHAYVAAADGRLHVVDLRNPVLPRAVTRERLLRDPRRLLLAGRHLYATDGVLGLVVFDLADPARPRPVGAMPATDPRGLSLAWPWLCVADGAGGLVVVDVAEPERPRHLASVDLNGESTSANEALDVAVFFQYSRLQQEVPRGRRRRAPAEAQGPPRLERTPARLLAFVAAGLDGLCVVDLTEPKLPRLLESPRSRRTFRFPRGDVRSVAVNTVFDLGTPGGEVPSRERDYLYVFVEQGADADRQQHVRVFDVSDPLQPLAPQRSDVRVYGGSGRLHVVRTYNAPFLQHFVAAAGAAAGAGDAVATLIEVGRMSSGATPAAVLDGGPGVLDVAFEEFAFDRLQDEDGNWTKDLSHPDCRYATPAEMLRVLRAPLHHDRPEQR